MRQEYRPDFTNVVSIATSTTDNSGTIPIPKGATNLLNFPGSSGSLWFINVDGAPAAINYNAPAVFATNGVVEIGNNMTMPVEIPPGTVVHAITSASTGKVSLIRALRMS